MKKKIFLSNSNDIAQIYLMVKEEVSLKEIADKYSISNTQVRSIRDTVNAYFDNGFLYRQKNIRAWRNAIKIIKQHIKNTPIEQQSDVEMIKNNVKVETIQSSDQTDDRIQQHIKNLVEDITIIVKNELSDDFFTKLEQKNEELRIANLENDRLTQLLTNNAKKSNWISFISNKLDSDTKDNK